MSMTQTPEQRAITFTREEDRLRFFIHGIASLSLRAPDGVNPAVHHAKLLRTIRQSARTILERNRND